MDDDSDALEAFERQLFQVDDESSSDSDDRKELEELLYSTSHYASELGGAPTSVGDNEDSLRNDDNDLDTREESNIKKTKKARKSNTKRYYDKADTSMDNIFCYNCEETGHMARDCINRSGIICYNCEETGHIARDCKNKKGIVCYNCEETGHIARDCLKPKECSKSKKLFQKICRCCQKVGHFAKDCLKERSSKVCYRCQESGHIAKDCKKEKCYSSGESDYITSNKSKKSKLSKLMLNSLNCVNVRGNKSKLCRQIDDKANNDKQLNVENCCALNEVNDSTKHTEVNEENLLGNINAGDLNNEESVTSEKNDKNNKIICDEECHKEEVDEHLLKSLDSTSKLQSSEENRNEVVLFDDKHNKNTKSSDDGKFKNEKHVCQSSEKKITESENLMGNDSVEEIMGLISDTIEQVDNDELHHSISNSVGKSAEAEIKKDTDQHTKCSTSTISTKDVNDTCMKCPMPTIRSKGSVINVASSDTSDREVTIKNNSKRVRIEGEHKITVKNIKRVRIDESNNKIQIIDLLSDSEDIDDEEIVPNKNFNEKETKNTNRKKRSECKVTLEYTPSKDLGINDDITNEEIDMEDDKIDGCSTSVIPTNKNISVGEIKEVSKTKSKRKSKEKKQKLDHETLNNLRNILGDSGDEERFDLDIILDSTLCLPSINVDTSNDTEFESLKTPDVSLAQHSCEDMKITRLDGTYYNPTELQNEHLDAYGVSTSPISNTSHEKLHWRNCLGINSPITKRAEKQMNEKRKTFLRTMKKHLTNSMGGKHYEVNADNITSDEPYEHGASKKRKRAREKHGFNFQHVMPKEIVLLD